LSTYSIKAKESLSPVWLLNRLSKPPSTDEKDIFIKQNITVSVTKDQSRFFDTPENLACVQFARILPLVQFTKILSM
jgi:hypothetical protein